MFLKDEFEVGNIVISISEDGSLGTKEMNHATDIATCDQRAGQLEGSIIDSWHVVFWTGYSYSAYDNASLC